MSPDARELEIVRLGAQGDGVAETPAGPVFVPRALPGERVRAEVAGGQASGHARLIEVLAASPDRVAAPCRHFGACGGCVAQHMSEGVYRDWKREMVGTAFAHRALRMVLDDMVIIAPATRRRVALGAEKRGGSVSLGYREEGTHTLVDIGSCPVMLPAIGEALPGLRRIADAALPEDGALRMTVTAVQGGLDVALDGTDNHVLDTKALDAKARARIAHLAAAVGALRVTASGHLVIQSAAPKLSLGGADVILPPTSFVQATAEAEAAIGAVLVEATRKAKRIADLFSGAGTFTFLLARRARISAYDGDRPAIEALAVAAKGAMGTKPIEARVRDLFAEPLSRTELDGFDAVVFDPPRAGAKAQAEMLARSKVPVVCAVSCNPATLARDCRILVDGGYRIERVVPVDQFVWSPHVEAVAVLRR